MQELHRAAEAGDTETLQSLLAAGLDPDGTLAGQQLCLSEEQRERASWTPLHRAAAAGQAAAVGALIAAGASPAARSSAGLQPLHLAAQGGHVSSILALCSAGAHTADCAHAVDGDSGSSGSAAGTPLGLAVGAGQLAAVQALLGVLGAPPDAGAVTLAAASSDAALLYTLLAAGGEASQQALCSAAAAGSADGVRLLLEAGARAEGARAAT